MAGRRADWDDDLTRVFLDLCIAEKEKSSCKTGLTRAGWRNLYRNFRQQTGKYYENKQLQNKFNSLKRLYKVWKRLKAASGGGWDGATGTLTMDDKWWDDRIAEDHFAEKLRKKPLPHEDKMTILFGGDETEDGDLFCVGGIGDRIPSGGIDDNRPPVSDDNVGCSSVVRATQRAGNDQVAGSPPAKRTRNVEYCAEPISESMLERGRNETSAMSREQEEVAKLLRIVEEDGVSQGSELYFIATELFTSATRRAAFRSFRAAEHRIAWLRWTWKNAQK